MKNNLNKTNLKGLNTNSNLIKNYKASLFNLSKEQIEASIGLILGDASLQTQNKGKNYRLKFEWSDKTKCYLDHVYPLFYEWVYHNHIKNLDLVQKVTKLLIGYSKLLVMRLLIL